MFDRRVEVPEEEAFEKQLESAEEVFDPEAPVSDSVVPAKKFDAATADVIDQSIEVRGFDDEDAATADGEEDEVG